MRLLDLQIIDHSSHACNHCSITGRSTTFGLAGDIAAQGNDATGSLDLDLAALDSRIGIEPALHVAGNLRIGAGRRFRTPSKNAQHQGKYH